VHIIWRSLRALREHLIKDSNFHEYCSNQRFDTVIVQCMDMYPKSAMLQAQALRVLAAMAYGNDRVSIYLSMYIWITLCGYRCDMRMYDVSMYTQYISMWVYLSVTYQSFYISAYLYLYRCVDLWENMELLPLLSGQWRIIRTMRLFNCMHVPHWPTCSTIVLKIEAGMVVFIYIPVVYMM